MFLFNDWKNFELNGGEYLNTSYVSIQLLAIIEIRKDRNNLNTSYVSIQSDQLV